MPDGRRRSRQGWADSMEAGPADPPAHVHRLPPFVRISVVGLLVAVLLLVGAVGALTVFVYQANLYVQGRGEYRDAEQARAEAENRERLRAFACELADTFPADNPSLDRLRATYGCGPGLPFDDLSPEERSRLNGGTGPPTALPLPPGVEILPEGFRAGASPDGPPQPYFPAPGQAEPPAAVPYPPGFPPPDPYQPTE